MCRLSRTFYLSIVHTSSSISSLIIPFIFKISRGMRFKKSTFYRIKNNFFVVVSCYQRSYHIPLGQFAVGWIWNLDRGWDYILVKPIIHVGRYMPTTVGLVPWLLLESVAKIIPLEMFSRGLLLHYRPI